MTINPKTDNLIASDIAKETKPSMVNLKAILLEAGMAFENAVKTLI